MRRARERRPTKLPRERRPTKLRCNRLFMAPWRGGRARAHSQRVRPLFARASYRALHLHDPSFFYPVTFCASQLHARVSLPQPLQFGKAKTPTPHAARSRRPGRGSGPQNCARATASSPLASTTAPYTPVEVPPDLVLAPQNPAPPPAGNRQRPSRPMYYAAHTRGAFSTPFTAL